MVCGIDTNIVALDKLKEELIKTVEGLATPPKGLKASIDSVSALVSSELPAIVKKLEESLPGLAGLIPSATLIEDMTGLLGLISNPSAFVSGVSSIISKYGDVPGVDINELASSILSGNISADSICDLIPNVVKTQLNEVIKKGIIPVPPTKEVKKIFHYYDEEIKQADPVAKIEAAVKELQSYYGLGPDGLVKAVNAMEKVAAKLGIPSNTGVEGV